MSKRKDGSRHFRQNVSRELKGFKWFCFKVLLESAIEHGNEKKIIYYRQKLSNKRKKT